MLLNLLIWLIIVVVAVVILKQGMEFFETPAPLARIIMLVVGAVLLIALLINIWPLLTNPGFHHFG